MALVFLFIFFSIFFGSIFKLFKSISAKTGFPPACTILLIAEQNVSGEVIISSFFFNFKLIKDKKIAYGKQKIYNVRAIDAKDLKDKFDLIKIDAEGSEIDIIKRFSKKTFENTDIIMEISTEFNKKLMWMLRKKKNLKIYSQKNGWDQIKRIEDLPNTHREGSIFISHKNKFLK